MEAFFTALSPTSIITMIVLAILIFFKNQLINYLGTMWRDIGMYRTRRYDRDNDPATGQWCTAKEPATGENNLAYVEKYSKIHFNPSKNLVYPWFFYDTEKTMMYCIPMSYASWRSTVTGRLPIKIANLPFKTIKKNF